MFRVFTNAWKVQDIRKKMLYVIAILAVYRLGSQILLPGLDIPLFTSTGSTSPTDAASIFSMITGGGTASIVAMGIGPYITASIIMQLLTVAIPKLEQMQKEGEDGRKKIGQYTRVVAVFLALMQGAGTVYSLQNYFINKNMFVYTVATIAMVTGTIFIMWLGEFLTEKGIGNGSSFIIFANILSNLPNAVKSLYTEAIGSPSNVAKVIFILALFIAVIAFVVLIQDGERRIAVQYSKKMVGRQMYGGQSSYIPIKVNIAGVMSIIFAISLLQFPSLIARFFPSNQILASVSKFLDFTQFSGAIIYVILIFCFTFFYTSFAMNPIEMAENMKKSGGFIPGIRPGKSTSDYIKRTIDRLSWIGAAAYAFIALMPVLFQAVLNVKVGFGGTTLLIVTGVCLELVKQLESQLLMRHYKGFLS